jgi:hypothetical protein
MKKVNNVLIIVVFAIGLGFILLLSFGGAKIYKTATLSKKGNAFVITVRGKGVGHPAGFSDIFFPKTHEMSEEYLIPRDIGIIKGEELPTQEGYYKSTGTITITHNHLKIDLFAINTDDNKLESHTWNGTYDLVRVK